MASIYPIDLRETRTRWIATTCPDACGYAAALIAAGISHTMTYSRPTPEVEQWTFDRVTKRTLDNPGNS